MMRRAGFVLVTWIVQLASCSREDALIDTGVGPLGLGRIQGSNATTVLGVGKLGREYYFWFSGIPYAKPGSYMGINRFKPSEVWDGPLPDDTPDVRGIFYANPRRANIVCLQKPAVELPTAKVKTRSGGNESITEGFHKLEPLELMRTYYGRQGVEKRRVDLQDYDSIWGQEDCLTLAVSSPKLPNKGEGEVKLPVLVFIHGGGFDQFWGNFGGQRLLNHDMVLVSINYRLGILGALNLGIPEAPGNGMLYDCITALRWVHKYIHHFGGDPTRVTVAGQSAGAVLATAVFVSPSSKGLIHGVIGASGSILSVWASQAKPVQETLKFISFTEQCKHLLPDPLPEEYLPTEEEARRLRNCMAFDVSTKEQINTRDRYGLSENREGRLGYDALVPSIQDPSKLASSGIELVLPKSPLEIVKSKEQTNVPIMMGAARHDGSFVMISTFYDYLVYNGLDSDGVFIKNGLFAAFLQGVGIKDPSNAMIHTLQKTYLGEAANSDDILSKAPGLLDLHTAIGFKAGGYGLVEQHSKLNPNSYWYAFDYKGTFSTFDIGSRINLIKGGVAHADDLLYLFILIPLISEKEFEVSRRYVGYWANFVIHGNPNGPGAADLPFPRYNPADHPFLIINQTDRVGIHARDTWQGNSEELEWIFKH